MDYQLQQYALLPLLAAAYALHFTSDDMMRMYNECSAAINAGDLSQLPELHATSSGLKVSISFALYAAIFWPYN